MRCRWLGNGNAWPAQPPRFVLLPPTAVTSCSTTVDREGWPHHGRPSHRLPWPTTGKPRRGLIVYEQSFAAEPSDPSTSQPSRPRSFDLAGTGPPLPSLAASSAVTSDNEDRIAVRQVRNATSSSE
jgi:hypothetical protein